MRHPTLSEAGDRFVESLAHTSRAPRSYRPWDRSPGLRHVPDEPVGRALLASVIFHAVLILALVRLTSSPPAPTGIEVWADLTSASEEVTAKAQDAPPQSAPVARMPEGQTRPEGPAIAKTAIRVPVSASSLKASTSREQTIATVSRASAGHHGSVEAPVTRAEPPAPAAVASADQVPSDAAFPVRPGPQPGPEHSTIPDVALSSPTFEGAPAQTLTPVAELNAPPSDAAASETARPAPLPSASPRSSRETTADTPAEATVPRVADAGPSAPGSTAVTSPRGTPLGLGTRRVLVRLEGARNRTTAEAVGAVTGSLLGGLPDQLLLYVNGVPTTLPVKGRSFDALIPLEPGLNQIRAVALGPGGVENEDSITVDYTPPPTSPAITLTSPHDGVAVGADDAPVIVVEGRVADPALDSVWLVVNDRRIRTSVRGGLFRQILPISAPLVRLWAETPANGSPVRRSEVVTIHGPATTKPAGVLVMEWPAGADGLDVEVSAAWRARPEILDETTQTIKLAAADGVSRGRLPVVFYFRSAKPGVYTVTLRYEGSAPAGDLKPTLYLPGHEGLIPRPLRPVALNGTGKAVLAKVLLPFGVLWDQDEWFTGRSESVDTITKFRVSEGVSWVERKPEVW